MCGIRLAENTWCNKWWKISHLRAITPLCRAISLQLRHMLTRGKKLGKQQYLLHISSQYGELSPLTADIGSLVWGTPANFNRFHVLAWLLHQHRSMEVNQTLHDVWPSSALVHMYTLPGLLPPNGIFCAKFTSIQILRCPILAVLLHSTGAVGISQTLRRSAEGATYNIWQGGHHVGHRSTFQVMFIAQWFSLKCNTPCLKKHPTYGLLQLWHTWTNFDIFWQKCYR